MREKTIMNPSTYDNLPELRRYLEMEPLTLREVSIKYNYKKGLPDERDIDNWPVKLLFLDQKGKFVIIRIFNLTAGYNGSGPNDLEEILKYLNVEHDPQDILSLNKMDKEGYINLHYEML